jgi:hypothetical protein
LFSQIQATFIWVFDKTLADVAFTLFGPHQGVETFLYFLNFSDAIIVLGASWSSDVADAGVFSQILWILSLLDSLWDGLLLLG